MATCCSYFQVIFLVFTYFTSFARCDSSAFDKTPRCNRGGTDSSVRLNGNFYSYATTILAVILILNIVLFIFVKRKYLLIILIIALVLHYFCVVGFFCYLYWIHYENNGCEVKPWDLSKVFDENAVIIISSILIQIINIIAIACAYKDYKKHALLDGYFWNTTIDSQQCVVQLSLQSCKQFPAYPCQICQSTECNMIGYNGTWYQHEEWCALVHGWGAHDQPTSTAGNEIKKYGYNGTLYQNAVECNDVRKV